MINSNQKKRLFSTLDGMRGIAAILILMRHVPYFSNIRFQESYLAVDLFFLLSGVVIANAYQTRLLNSLGPLEFVWFRIVRIYPMYMLGCLITLAYWFDTKTAPLNYLSIILFAIFLLPKITEFEPFRMDAPAWSLFSEIIANIAFAFFVKWLTNGVLIAMIGFFAFSLAYTLHLQGNLDIGFFSNTIIFGIFRVGYSFFAGVLIYRFYAKKLPSIRPDGVFQAVPWFVIVVVAAVLTATPTESVRLYFDFLFVVLVFPCLVFLSLCLDPQRKTATVFKFLGIISYPMYAIHAPLGKWIPIVLGSGAAKPSDQNAIWIGVGFVVFLALLCVLLDRYVDGPVRRLALIAGTRIEDFYKRVVLALKGTAV